MVLQYPWTFLFFIYWLFCLILFKKSIDKQSLIYIARRSKKVFILVLILFILSWIFYKTAVIIENKYELSIFFYLLAIIFDVTGTVIFVWYGFKGGALVLVFPLLLSKYRSNGAQNFVEKNIARMSSNKMKLRKNK